MLHGLRLRQISARSQAWWGFRRVVSRDARLGWLALTPRAIFIFLICIRLRWPVHRVLEGAPRPAVRLKVCLCFPRASSLPPSVEGREANGLEPGLGRLGCRGARAVPFWKSECFQLDGNWSQVPNSAPLSVTDGAMAPQPSRRRRAGGAASSSAAPGSSAAASAAPAGSALLPGALLPVGSRFRSCWS